MKRLSVHEQQTPQTMAALTMLLARLRRAAVNGVVPEHVFAAQARALGLGEGERSRLKEELTRLGLPVGGPVARTDADRPDARKVPPGAGGDALSRRHVAQALLRRYMDPHGYVPLRAVDGVARLAGLSTREAAWLRAENRVRHDAPAATARADQPVPKAPDIERPPAPTGSRPLGAESLAGAVATALAFLEEDRFRRRPEKFLLTAEAEVGLAVLIRGGATHMSEEPAEASLSSLPSTDIRIRARDCLVVHNQGLVHKLVPHYLEQGLDYEDLFQNGVLGLMRAARKFDATKGFKFSTYATWWIRQSLTRAIADEGALIRIPVHLHEQIRKVAAVERALASQGRPARAADVAVLCDLSVTKVEEARRLSRRTDSLDRVIGDGSTLGDLVGRTQSLPSVDHAVVSALMWGQTMDVVHSFAWRESRILTRRIGLDGDAPSTLEDLGREFGVTRERIRQLEGKVLVELRLRLRAASLVAPPEAGTGVGEQRRKRRAPQQPTRTTPEAGSAHKPRSRPREAPQAQPVAPAPTPTRRRA